jgi:hypothetical protein
VGNGADWVERLWPNAARLAYEQDAAIAQLETCDEQPNHQQTVCAAPKSRIRRELAGCVAGSRRSDTGTRGWQEPSIHRYDSYQVEPQSRRVSGALPLGTKRTSDIGEEEQTEGPRSRGAPKAAPQGDNARTTRDAGAATIRAGEHRATLG